MNNIGRETVLLAKQLTEQVKQRYLRPAFEFKFEPIEQPNAEGLGFIQLVTANKGHLLNHCVASGGELSRIALVMQVMNAEKDRSKVLVTDGWCRKWWWGEVQLKVVGRLLADWLSMSNFYVLPPSTGGCTIRSTFVSQKQQTRAAIVQLDENQSISERACQEVLKLMKQPCSMLNKCDRKAKFQASST